MKVHQHASKSTRINYEDRISTFYHLEGQRAFRRISQSN